MTSSTSSPRRLNNNKIMKTNKLAEWVVPTFDNSVASLEADFWKFLAKESGYPRHRAWADSLDQRADIICEDFASKHGLAFEFDINDRPLAVRFFKLQYIRPF